MRYFTIDQIDCSNLLDNESTARRYIENVVKDRRSIMTTVYIPNASAKSATSGTFDCKKYGMTGNNSSIVYVWKEHKHAYGVSIAAEPHYF
ncbi:hypothetical protein AHYW_004379 (plasmid) [Providencia manganoxydans]